MIYTGKDVPRKGNVDRNAASWSPRRASRTTFPARGTWIEIGAFPTLEDAIADVPRKGNVDRNTPLFSNPGNTHDVPRKGNVDRNSRSAYTWSSAI